MNLQDTPAVLLRRAATRPHPTTFLSSWLETLVGASGQALSSDALSPLIVEEDRVALLDAVSEAVRRGGPYRAVYRLDTLDGRRVWAEERGQAVRTGDGAVEVHGLIFDVTAQRQRELETARQLAAQQRQLVELATHPSVGGGDVEGLARILTERAVAVLGIERAGVWLLDGPDELRLVDMFVRSRGEHLHGMVLRASDYPAYFEAMRSGRVVDAHEARSDPRTADFTEGYLVPEGIFSMLDAAIRSQGEVTGVICLEATGQARRWALHEMEFAGVLADQVSHTLLNRQRVQDQQEQERLQRLLQRGHRLEAIGRLAGGIAHDFNNLLSVVSCSAELLLLQSPDGQDTESLETILSAVDSANRLTRQLLAFSRGQQSRPTLLFPSQAIAELKPLLRNIVSRRCGLELGLRARAPILADRSALEQIVMNLVINARDAMPGGGTVWVEATDEQLRPGLRPGLPGGAYVKIVVRDEGVGIPDDLLEQIFEPFFSTKGEDKGTGLGLSTVYGLVRQGDGDIEVQSQLGHGTAFTIWFPAR